jgi:hypothetical protein
MSENNTSGGTGEEHTIEESPTVKTVCVAPNIGIY